MVATKHPERGAPKALKLLAQLLWCADDDRFEREHGLSFGFDSGIACHLEVAHHLDRAVTGFGFGRSLTAEDSTRCGFRIDRIILALPPTRTSIGPVHFEYAVPARLQVASKTCSVGSCALDAEGSHRTEGPRPGFQALISLSADRYGDGTEVGADRTQRHRRVGLLVGVDADDNVRGWRSLLHGRHTPAWVSTGGRGSDRTVTGPVLKLLSGHVPHGRRVLPKGPTRQCDDTGSTKLRVRLAERRGQSHSQVGGLWLERSGWAKLAG